MFRGLESSATQIARYLAIFSAAKTFWRCRLSYRHQGGRDHHARRWTPASRTLVSCGPTKAILKLRCGAFQRATSGPHRTPLSAIAGNAKSAHNRAYSAMDVNNSRRADPQSKKGPQGESNPEPVDVKDSNPDADIPDAPTLPAAPVLLLPMPPTSRLRPPTPPADATWLMRRTAVFGTAPLPVSLAKLGISTASRQLSEVRHVPASRQLSEVRHQHRFPSA